MRPLPLAPARSSPRWTTDAQATDHKDEHEVRQPDRGQSGDDREEAEVNRAQGTTKQRGYGAKHKALRRRWARDVCLGSLQVRSLRPVDRSRSALGSGPHTRQDRLPRPVTPGLQSCDGNAQGRRRTLYAFVGDRAVSRAW
jgi:hypothetical protein